MTIKRSRLMDAVIEAKMESICQGGTCEDYLKEVLRYGTAHAPLVDLTDEELLAMLYEHNLTEEDI